jgi:hypothetical protein
MKWIVVVGATMKGVVAPLAKQMMLVMSEYKRARHVHRWVVHVHCRSHGGMMLS